MTPFPKKPAPTTQRKGHLSNLKSNQVFTGSSLPLGRTCAPLVLCKCSSLKATEPSAQASLLSGLLRWLSLLLSAVAWEVGTGCPQQPHSATVTLATESSIRLSLWLLQVVTAVLAFLTLSKHLLNWFVKEKHSSLSSTSTPKCTCYPNGHG